MGWQQWPRLTTSKQAKATPPGTAATAPYHKNCIWPYVTRIADSGMSGRLRGRASRNNYADRLASQALPGSPWNSSCERKNPPLAATRGRLLPPGAAMNNDH